jgi:methyl coenzyme M reductase subunit D
LEGRCYRPPIEAVKVLARVFVQGDVIPRRWPARPVKGEQEVNSNHLLLKLSVDAARAFPTT